MELKEILGKQVDAISRLPDKLLERETAEILADKIFLKIGNTALAILPITETDELETKLIEATQIQEEHQLENILEQHYNKKLSCVWKATNWKGYRDVVLLSFDNLIPAVLILSEGSGLKVLSIH